jgi:hypothetical protein
MSVLEYPIFGKYQNGETEEIDTAEDHKEAKRLLDEYRMAYGEGWSLWLGKPRKQPKDDQ